MSSHFIGQTDDQFIFELLIVVHLALVEDNGTVAGIITIISLYFLHELMRKLFYFARKEYESSLQTCCSSHFLHRMEPRAATQNLFVSCWTLTCFVMYFLSVWLASPTIVSQTVSSICHEGLSGTGSKRNRGVGSMRC